MAPQKHRPALLAALAAGAVVTSSGLVLPAASAEETRAPGTSVPAADPTAAGETAVDLLYFNDYHGRLGSDPLLFAGAIEQLRAGNEDGTLLLSGGDNVGASEYVSAVQQDDPTLDVLDALGLDASAVGNHEFDRGADDLTGRITERADFPYLAANVTGPDGELVTEASATFDVDGVRVGVVGAVTQQTATLVSPGAIEGITFGDPVEAVNAEAGRLEEDGADVVVAVYHEGAADASDALGDRLVTGTSATVDVVLNGHTHEVYDEGVDADGDGDLDRAVLQAGSYGGSLGRISLSYDAAADDVDLTTAVLAVDEVVTATEQELVARYPRVAEVAGIVAAAEEVAVERGRTPVGEITGDITTAYGLRDGKPARDDRGAESSLGNLVAESIRDSLNESNGVQIGLINPGGLRADLLWADDPAQVIDGERDGVVTESEANQVMPFANNLSTVTLTGEQFERVLEQQWQPAGASRSYLQLGLSENVSYTFDAARPPGRRPDHVDHGRRAARRPGRRVRARLRVLPGGGRRQLHRPHRGHRRDRHRPDRPRRLDGVPRRPLRRRPDRPGVRPPVRVPGRRGRRGLHRGLRGLPAGHDLPGRPGHHVALRARGRPEGHRDRHRGRRRRRGHGLRGHLGADRGRAGVARRRAHRHAGPRPGAVPGPGRRLRAGTGPHRRARRGAGAVRGARAGAQARHGPPREAPRAGRARQGRAGARLRARPLRPRAPVRLSPPRPPSPSPDRRNAPCRSSSPCP
ncbi:bifunctional UDP-sugar hydrolase/5'-nucleotidase [Kocuria sp. CPCC 205281]